MPRIISVIIPVYNVEKYLEQCVESILSQAFNDYEVILVDDGSTDNSGSICDLYSDKYDQIKTIHKENGGLSDARNVGLQHATGEFILFIDADDYIFKDSLAAINISIEEMPDVDVVFLEAVKVFEDGSTIPLGDGYQKESIKDKTHEEVIAHLSKLPKFPGSACTKLIRRSLIYDNNLYFQKGLLAEDIDWTVRLLLTAQKYNYCQKDYYYYRQNREGSITNTASIKSLNSLIHIIKKWSRNMQHDPPVSKFQKGINAFMAYEYLVLLLAYGGLNREEKRNVETDVKSYSWLLSESKIVKVRIARLINGVFGLEAAASFLVLYYKLGKRKRA
jgi:glycosyltransferase involved in cell wall biosynthesis